MKSLNKNFSNKKNIYIKTPTNKIKSYTVQKADTKPLANSFLNKEIKVLLVEDDCIIAKATTAILTGLNCTVDLAPNGQTALQKIENNYDIIFMDIGLPDMSGFEVAKKIRQTKNLPNKHIPIIALTANSDPSYKEKFKSAGIQAIEYKPLTKVVALAILKVFVFKLK